MNHDFFRKKLAASLVKYRLSAKKLGVKAKGFREKPLPMDFAFDPFFSSCQRRIPFFW